MKSHSILNYSMRVLLLALLWLGVQGRAYAEHGRIKIGAITILSGDSAQIGVQTQRGAQIAIDELNAAGGVNAKVFEFIWEDESGGKAMHAVSAYGKLTTIDKVEYIFGPAFQDALLALAPMAKRDNLLLLTPSTPALALPNVFSTWLDPKIESEQIAKYIVGRFKRVSVLAEQQSWVLMVADEFKKKLTEFGGMVSSYADPSTENKNLRSEVLRVKQSQPEAVFIASYTLFPIYVKELRRVGVSVPIFTIEADNAVVQAAGPDAEGVISIGPSAPESNFTRSYRKRYGGPPDMPAQQSYDAVNMLAEAIRTNGEGTDNVLKYFRDFKSYQGASGTITNFAGSISTTMAFFEVRGAVLQKISDAK